VTGEAFTDPVADGRRAERPTGHAPDVELAGDLAVVFHHERVAATIAVLLQQSANADTHVERGRPVRDRRFPRLKPGAVVEQFLLQHARITRPDEPQLDRA